MVSAAHGGDTPYYLTLARQCERWGALAVLGQDPPYQILILMEQAVNIYDTIKLVEGAKTAEDIKRIPAATQRWYFEQVKMKGYV